MAKQCLECGKKHYKVKCCSRKCSAIYREKTYIKDTYEKIIRLHNIEKKNFTEIATILGISLQTMTRYAKALKITPKPQYMDHTGRDMINSKVIKCLYNGPQNGKHTSWLILCNCGREFVCRSYALNNRTEYSCTTCSAKRRRLQVRLTKYIWGQIVNGAQRRQISVTIDKDYAYELFLKQKEKCALTNLPLKFAETSRGHVYNKETTASLDRIDSSKGYVKDNVQWVHKDVNRMKWDLSEERFIDLCRQIVKIANKKNREKNR